MSASDFPAKTRFFSKDGEPWIGFPKDGALVFCNCEGGARGAEVSLSAFKYGRPESEISPADFRELVERSKARA